MAEEELVEGPGEETQVEETEEQREPTASELAADMGWKPKDQWQGDPDAWKPAADFIRAGRDIQQGTARELKAMREQMERLGGTTAQILKDREAQINSEWEARFNQAVEDGDTTAAARLAENRPAPKTDKTPDPLVAEWIGKNAWYNSDPLAQARAGEISDRLKHLPVADQLAQVDRAIRKEFPEHFPKTAKDPPATQTAASRNPNPGNRVKGFADMPQASQQAALEMERLNGVKKEDFAKNFWAIQLKKAVRA